MSAPCDICRFGNNGAATCLGRGWVRACINVQPLPEQEPEPQPQPPEPPAPEADQPGA